jgi:hypothetical protein
MPCFADLAEYDYVGGRVPGLLCVGWLAAGQSFATGKTPEAFRVALAVLCETRAVTGTWGHHACEFCPGASWHDRYYCINGTGEIRVRSKTGTRYAAPRLIMHYVEAHDYLPPADFIAAVMESLACGGDTCGAGGSGDGR